MIWNAVLSLPPETRINDYNLVYYDSSDLSYEAEDKVIQASRLLFDDLPVKVEIRNQVCVYLWYRKKHRIHYAPYQTMEAGIDSWISTSAMIGIRLEGSGEWSVYTPQGLSDFFNMRLSPNTALGTEEVYNKKVKRWMGIWSGLIAEPWPESR